MSRKYVICCLVTLADTTMCSRLKNESDRVVAFDRAGALFIFNFHPTNSYTDYRIGVDIPGEYRVVLDSDSKENGGHGRIDHQASKFFTSPMEWNGRRNFVQVYLPTRTCLVLGKVG